MSTKTRPAPPTNAKSLEQHLRDGTFVPSRHQHLLEAVDGTVAQWQARSVRQGGSMVPAQHFEAWCRKYIKHTVGRWFGEPFTLEPWQRTLVAELLAVDKVRRGRPLLVCRVRMASRAC
jgi:hypothetical protein